MREFTTAAKEPLQDEVLDITIRRNQFDPEYVPEVRVLKAHKPTDGQFAILMASFGKGASGVEGVAGPLNFLDSLLDEGDRRYVLNRMLDGKDPFGPAECEEIIEWLVEEWSGRPTQPSSGSTGSQPNDGPNSTPTTQPSTSSGSAPIGY